MGMRQRLGLACALLGDPPVLLLDEPLNGLDPDGIAWVRVTLRRLASEGRTILLSSHVLAEVATTVDDVVIIERGRLVAAMPLAELAANHTTVVRTPQAAALTAALLAAGHLATRSAPDEVTVADAAADVVGLLAARARRHRARPRRAARRPGADLPPAHPQPGGNRHEHARPQRDPQARHHPVVQGGHGDHHPDGTGLHAARGVRRQARRRRRRRRVRPRRAQHRARCRR